MPQLFLFGAPRIKQNGQAVALRRSKALALLAYLAVTRRPQDRDTLLALLWPEFDPASARNNLRRELSMLKAALDQELLVVDRRQVVWNTQLETWLDIAEFQEQLAIYKQHGHAPGELCVACAAALTGAAKLYSDDFLAGFSLPESPAFDEWQFFVREELRQLLAEALAALVGWHGQRGEYSAALVLARRWLALDGLHEPAQRELMRLYAWLGQPAAALRQYEERARLLDKELGVAPEAATTALYEDIKARRLAPPAAPISAEFTALSSELPEETLNTHHAHLLRDNTTHNSQLTTHNLSLPQTTSFVGRQRELADIIRRLTDPACRLLTLSGPGGIGKTRLALQAAAILADGWAGEAALTDGLLFVPLAAVGSIGGLVSALATAAHFDFYPNVAPQQQLLDYFRDKRMLVVLDNFEQLLDAAGFVGELLDVAPQLLLLVTSREALNLREEWFHPVEGLSFPTAADDITGVTQLARYDAVRLFEQHARRARSDFTLGRERVAVVRLCRLVGGIPLALELAASWLKVLSVDQVVAALERGLDILTTRDKNVPERHRSMRTVLEESWRLLAAEEQQVLAGLAVFCGGFDATAAATIAGATRDVLAGLMDKALLRPAAEGRFQLHELLRQFAQDQLRAIDKETATRQQHSAYYLALLDTWGNAFVGGDQQTRLMEVSREIENIRAAWEWSAVHADIDAIQRALEPLFNFYQSHGRYQEGLADFAGAAARMLAAGALAAHPQRELLRTRLLARLGTFCYSLGDYGAASAHLEGSLRAAQALGLQREEALALNMLSQVSAGRGEYSLAKEQLLESLAIGRAIDDKSSVATALEKLAELIADHGEQQPVKQLALESLALSRELRRPDWIAHALDRIGFITFCLGEYHEAAAYYRESLAAFDSIGHQLGRGLALGGLGLVKWAQAGDETAGAKAFFEQSLAIFREIGHQRHIAERLIDLSHHASDSGDYVQAQRYALEALTLTHRLGSPLHMCIVLCCLGHASSKQGDLQASSAYLAEALQLTIAAQMPIAGIEALFYSAMLMIEEAVRADPHGPAGLQRSCRALELLELVICYPSTWHVYRVRARRMSEQLQRDLPPDLAEAAIERGQQLDWLVGVETLRGELAQPTPAASA